MKSIGSDAMPTVDVFELARTRGHVEGQIPLGRMDRLAPLLASAVGALQWRFEGAPDPRGRASAVLGIRGAVAMSCDKCGSAVELPIRIESRFWFVESEAELNAQPIDPDDESEPLIGRRDLALAQLIEDEVILALPMSPRHEHCRPDAEATSEEHGERYRPLASLALLKARH